MMVEYYMSGSFFPIKNYLVKLEINLSVKLWTTKFWIKIKFYSVKFLSS